MNKDEFLEMIKQIGTIEDDAERRFYENRQMVPSDDFAGSCPYLFFYFLPPCSGRSDGLSEL